MLTHRKWHEIWLHTFINYYILLTSLLGLVKARQAVAVYFCFCFVFKRHIKLLLFIIMIIGAVTCKIVWVDFEHVKYTSNGCVD